MCTQWDSQGITRARLQRKVSLAVQVIDDFTGMPVTSADVRVEAAQLMSRPVRKGDGFFVFLDSTEPVLDITVRSWAYHPTAVRVDLRQMARLNPVVKLRLTPNRNGRIPPQTTCLEGVAPAGSLVRVYCENDPRPLRLLYDYQRDGREAGCLIQLYDPAQGDLVGRSFVLFRKDEPEPEYFSVSSTLEGDDGGYRLTAPLSMDCRKAGTTIFPLTCVQTDENGSFFLPMRAVAVKVCRLRICWSAENGSERTRSIELETGRVKRVDLTAGE